MTSSAVQFGAYSPSYSWGIDGNHQWKACYQKKSYNSYYYFPNQDRLIHRIFFLRFVWRAAILVRSVGTVVHLAIALFHIIDCLKWERSAAESSLNCKATSNTLFWIVNCLTHTIWSHYRASHGTSFVGTWVRASQSEMSSHLEWEKKLSSIFLSRSMPLKSAVTFMSFDWVRSLTLMSSKFSSFLKYSLHLFFAHSVDEIRQVTDTYQLPWLWAWILPKSGT